MGLLSCGAQNVSLRQQSRAFTPEDYEDVYEAWTRAADAYAFSRLQDVLNVTATFESWELRWAFVTRYAHDYGLPIEARTEKLRAALADAAQFHRFYVTLAGDDFRQSDLTGDLTAWRVLLVAPNGHAYPPIHIEKIRKPGAVEKTYFPSTSSQRHAFRIAFASRDAAGREILGSSTRKVVLRFTGALGTVDLTWKFR